MAACIWESEPMAGDVGMRLRQSAGSSEMNGGEEL